MLSKNNQVLARHAKADHQQRWALRKLTIGVASVLLGGTLLVVNGTPVAADQVNPENATAVKSEPEMSNTKQDAENAVTLASTASDRPAVNATSGEQSPAGVGAEAMLATPAASPAPSDPSVTAPPQSATLASGAPGQMQPAVTKQQAPEMGWRKMEDGDQLVAYYVIVREVTLVKPDGDEVVMPLQVWDTLAYVYEHENDELDPIQFAAIEVDPIDGAKAPVIPAISQSVHSFLNMDDDNIKISYDKQQPVQRIEVKLTGLPDGPEYDEIYDQYEDKATEYEKKIEAAGRPFGYLDGFLLKEKYKYIVADEPDEPAVVEGQEEKTITRTINVHLPNGEVQTTTQPVTLERKYTSVAGSEEKKYGPWTVGRWESFTAPEQTGYTALPGSVAEVEVTSESLDAVVDIYYRADEAVIESGQEEKTITRTINVHLPNGEVQTITQPVTLVREYTGVAGSDEKNYGPWNTGQWNAFTAPELAGYTAMPGSVASVEVTSESLDVVVDIYYRIDIPPKVEVGPDPEQPTTDPNPEQPTTDPDPEQPTTDPDPEQPTTDPDPEQPTTDPDPEQPTTDPDPEQPTTDPDPEQPTTDPDPERPTTDPDPEQPTTDPDPERPIGHPVAPATVAPDQQANLPQTGNATSSLVALLGATLATFLGSLLLLGKRKR